MEQRQQDHNYTKVISAGIIIFRRVEGKLKFLFLYRARGTWDFPRGRMEGGERSWQTAFREVREETGLRRNELKMHPHFKVYEKFPYSSNGRRIFKIVIFYLAETEQARVRISPEHEGYGWFSYAEARRLLARYKARVEILKKAVAAIEAMSAGDARSEEAAEVRADTQEDIG
jgi:8-oxo-dGTP pyrophosphatase MutT (NUDIX family)